MSQLWLQRLSEWLALPLVARSYALAAGAGGLVAEPQGQHADAGVLLLRGNGGHSACWLLFSDGPRVRVNGEPVVAGVHALADRDEIVLDGAGRAFLSLEALPNVAPFPGGDRRIFCARSKLEIARGVPAVRCSCGTWYLQSKEVPGFTYGPACLTCGRSTDLGGEPAWSPHEL
jgi:hypothetical protein